MEKALAKVQAIWGKEYPIVIGGDEIHTETKLKSMNPSRPSEVVRVFSKADHKLAKKAIVTAVAKIEDKSSEEKVLSYIQKGIQEGGRLICGGSKTEGDGYFIQPTVIADVDPMATIAQEKIFGPMLVVVKAKDFGYALERANNTEFGLTAGVCG